jgi:hypothetical protein
MMRVHTAPRAPRGLTLIEVIVVGVIVGALVFAALTFLFGKSSGTTPPPAVLERTEYYAEWESAPPADLTSGGATVSFKVQSRTDTLTNGFVSYSGAWTDVAGATVTFTLAGAAAARLAAGPRSNVLSVTVTTGADGLASAMLSPEGVGTGQLSVHVRMPSGMEGDGTPKRFEVQ